LKWSLSQKKKLQVVSIEAAKKPGTLLEGREHDVMVMDETKLVQYWYTVCLSGIASFLHRRF
jgi:hypothetical protein